MYEYDYLFKFIIIGDTGVGKSRLLMHFIDDQFREESHTTIGVEYGSKLLHLDKYVIKTQIWDTAGQDQYRSITRSYYKRAVGAIVVFDITKRSSFENLPLWIKDVSEQGKADILHIIIGNKHDKASNREVSIDEATTFAKQNNAIYQEVSAKEGFNVRKLFMDITSEVLNKIHHNEIDFNNENSGVKLGERSVNQTLEKEQKFGEPLL